MVPLLLLGVLAVATDPEPAGNPGPRGVEARVGLAAFAGAMGGASLTGLGLHVALEKRVARGDVQLALEGAYLGIGDPEEEVSWEGRMTRGAAIARFRFAEGRQDPVFGAWVDVGVGVERVAWARGGVLVRPELMIGMSGTVGGVLDDERGRGRIGDWAQVHVLLSRGPGCAGRRCATELEMGVVFGAGFYFSE